MDLETRYRLTPEFSVFIRRHKGIRYVHRVEHEEITGYSFPDVWENNELLDQMRRLPAPIDINYTKKHLAVHAGMKF